MNERLQELMDQCVFTKELVPPTQEEIFEHFARLVVDECLDIACKELSFAAYGNLVNKLYENFEFKL